MWKFSTSAASAFFSTDFLQISLSFFLKKEQALVLLLALINNNWRFQQHTVANSILLILWKEKDQLDQTFPFIHCCKFLPLTDVLFRTGGASLLRWKDCLRVLMGKRPVLDVRTVAFMLRDIKQTRNSASVEFRLCGQGGISLFWNWGLQYCLQGWQNPQLSFAKCSTNTDKSHEGDSVVTFVS